MSQACSSGAKSTALLTLPIVTPSTANVCKYTHRFLSICVDLEDHIERSWQCTSYHNVWSIFCKKKWTKFLFIIEFKEVLIIFRLINKRSDQIFIVSRYECDAVGEFALREHADIWCHQNCLKENPYCPAERCRCQ